MEKNKITIRPYGEGDLWLLERTLGDAKQMIHLNEPESTETIKKRHEKTVAMSKNQKAGCQYTILAGEKNEPAGNVGYWESEWKGQKGWEMGWFVLPEYQGQGLATEAARHIISQLAELNSCKQVFAFPSVNNSSSNAICRKLGFTLTEEFNIEYPQRSGKLLKANIWILNLTERE